jgi:hypothetical protein
MSLISGQDGAIAAGLHPYADLVMNTAPVAWWPLNSNLVDRIGGRNGALGTGSEIYVESLPKDHGAGFDCAGTNWISVAHALALKPAVGSAMVWFKAHALQGPVAIIQCDETGSSEVDGQFSLSILNDGSITASWQTAADGGTNTQITTVSPYYVPGQTVHALCGWDSSGVALYLDGNLIAKLTGHTTGLANNDLPWQFGKDGPSATIFGGVIDEIAIWNRLLTRNEIYALAQTEPDS